MPNYQNAKIYKLVCNETNKIYIGSTTNPRLSQRKAKHKCDYKRYINDKRGYVTSFEIVKNNNFEIFLIENVDCNNKDELRMRERYYIEKFDCVNKYIPGRTQNERYIINKKTHDECNKQSYQTNKKKILNERKRYYYYQCSWGGDKRYNNNLLNISLDIFQ